jgi:hypothetical protein
MFLYQTLYATVVIDTIKLKAKENKTNIVIDFDLTYHYDLGSERKGRDKHTCRLFDAKNRAHLLAQNMEVKSYMLERSMTMPYVKQKGVKKLLIECTSILDDKTVVSKTSLELKPDEQEIKVIKQIQEKKQKAKEEEFYKKNPPVIAIKKLRMVGVKKISYRNAKKKELLVEASSGNYILRQEDLPQITLQYISKDVHKALQKIAKKPIKAEHVVKKQRIKIVL